MAGVVLQALAGTIEAAMGEVYAGAAAAVPRLVTAAIVVVLAFAGITLAVRGARGVVGQFLEANEALIADLVGSVVGVVLWFTAALAVLSVLGLGEIAASLGTAAGFVALGVSYALSNMIADTVAGVYLLRDPDFTPGDTVTTESVTGTLADIGLRKSRLQLEDGNVVVLANRDVERRWTRVVEGE